MKEKFNKKPANKTEKKQKQKIYIYTQSNEAAVIISEYIFWEDAEWWQVVDWQMYASVEGVRTSPPSFSLFSSLHENFSVFKSSGHPQQPRPAPFMDG